MFKCLYVAILSCYKEPFGRHFRCRPVTFLSPFAVRNWSLHGRFLLQQLSRSWTSARATSSIINLIYRGLERTKFKPSVSIWAWQLCVYVSSYWHRIVICVHKYSLPLFLDTGLYIARKQGTWGPFRESVDCRCCFFRGACSKLKLVLKAAAKPQVFCRFFPLWFLRVSSPAFHWLIPCESICIFLKLNMFRRKTGVKKLPY